MNYKRIIISRTDGIGDVVLTLPLAGAIKKHLPDTEILFLGSGYTSDVVACCVHVDRFVNRDDISSLTMREKIEVFRDLGADAIIHVFPDKEIARLAKKSGIPVRSGTMGRLFHLSTCNRRILMTRRRSSLHEAQLNMKLARFIKNWPSFTLQEIAGLYGLKNIRPLKKEYQELLSDKKFNLVLHPKSKGSAREWGIDNFSVLSDILPKDMFRIFITGTENDGKAVREMVRKYPFLQDLTGRMDLGELISFIDGCDGLVAASTGPLHLAAALGKVAIGLYPPIRPMDPGRWAPVGTHASYLVKEKECKKCRKSLFCECIESLSPVDVSIKLIKYAKTRNVE
jgi:heptosyltransferase III